MECPYQIKLRSEDVTLWGEDVEFRNGYRLTLEDLDLIVSGTLETLLNGLPEEAHTAGIVEYILQETILRINDLKIGL